MSEADRARLIKSNPPFGGRQDTRCAVAPRRPVCRVDGIIALSVLSSRGAERRGIPRSSSGSLAALGMTCNSAKRSGVMSTREVPMSAPTTTESATTTLLRETFEGSNGPSTYFIDSDKKSGFFAVLDALSAAEASRPMRPGGSTVAGHAHHAGFHLDMSSAWMRGDREPRDWNESWSVKSVD